MPIIQVVSKSIWPKMEDPNKAAVNSKAKEILAKTISIIIEFGCFLFVFIQTYQCIKKFIDDPQGTEIRIVKGKDLKVKKCSFSDLFCLLSVDTFLLLLSSEL